MSTEKKMPTKSIRQSALDLLARREHTASELTKKLRLRGYPSEDISTILTALQQQGLLSNQRFIENYIHYRRSKGIGPTRLHAELLERGIDEELIEQALDFTDNAWLAEAFRAWQKRFKNKKPTDFKSRAQQMRFLYYRGFTREQVNSVLESKE